MTTYSAASSPATSSPPPWLLAAQDQPLIALLAVTALTVLSGALLGLAFPCGPVTNAQGIVFLVLSVLLGSAAGLVLPWRWTWLLVPALFLVAFELARLPASGPTVDLVRLDNLYGVLALILGRGLLALVSLMPMLLAVLVGAGLARRLAHTAQLSAGFWTAATLLGVGFAALLTALLLPARTPPILGEDGQPLPGSRAELTTVTLGGQPQGVMIRTRNESNPVLLYLSGGPGQSDLPFTRVLLEDFTRDFTVVGWDQRGTGKSYPVLEPQATLTLDRAVKDTHELTAYLAERFGQDRIYLLGESWGSTLAVLAAQQRPELYHAVIGSGQMVSQRETDRQLYRDVLDLARNSGDAALERRMLAYGEPPYRDIPFANGTVMAQYDRLFRPYTPPRSYVERGSKANLGPYGILGSEYTLIEKFNVLRGLIDMFTVLYPQLQQLDFRQDVRRLEVPYYMLDGAAELKARRGLAQQWYAALDAPVKRQFTFDNAGHSVVFEQFEAVHRLMKDTVLPDTQPRR